MSSAAANAETDSLTIKATDSVGTHVQGVFSVQVVAFNPLTITTSSPLPPGQQSASYSYQLNAIGGAPPYAWSFYQAQTGSNGWAVSSSGFVTGTPSTIETDTLYLQVTDSLSATAQLAASLVVGAGVADPYALRAPNTSTDKFLDTTQGADGAGTFASPWNNLTSARAQSLAAGQGLWVRNGSSFQLPDTRTLPSGNASNGLLNYIIFAVYPGESATINFPAGGVVFGGGNYWNIKGFSLVANDTGWILGNSSGSGSTDPVNNWNFIDCIGTQSDASGFTDNCGILKSDTGSNLQVIRGTWTGPSGLGNNQACLWFDTGMVPVNVIGALITGSACPIYFKHNPGSNPGGTVRNCIIRNAGRDFEAQRSYVSYVNTVFDTCSIALNASGGGAIGANSTFNHCTFKDSLINNGDGSSTGNAITNSVFAGAAATTTPTGSGFNMEYVASLGTNMVDYSATDGLTRYLVNHVALTQASFQSTYSPNEANGVHGTITFVGGAGGGGSSAAGWALTSGSVGHLAASDGTDCGVNATNLLTVN